MRDVLTCLHEIVLSQGWSFEVKLSHGSFSVVLAICFGVERPSTFAQELRSGVERPHMSVPNQTLVWSLLFSWKVALARIILTFLSEMSSVGRSTNRTSNNNSIGNDHVNNNDTGHSGDSSKSGYTG